MDAGCLSDDYSETEKPLLKNFYTADDKNMFHASVAKLNERKEGKEVNWGNNYEPKTLKDFICHKEKAEMLLNWVRSEQSSHYIIEGPPGVGKRTMARALLREDIGLNITEAREEFKLFHLKNVLDKWPVSHLHLKVIISSQHIEINLEDLKGYAADAVMELFKETETGLVHQQYVHGDHANYGAIILYKAEKLPREAQPHIRSFLETFKGHYKVVFCCCDVSQLQHLNSLCTVIQLLPPSDKEIIEVLKLIAKEEDIELPHQLAEDIARKSKNCLQQAIRSFEATWQSNYPFKDGQLIMTGWEEELVMMAKSIIEEQSPKRLFIVRQKLITMLEHNLSPDFIFITLVKELEKHTDDRIKWQIKIFNHECIAENAVGPFDGDTCMIPNTRNKFHHFLPIEEFVAKFMSHYKCYRGSLN